jgi:chromate reductase, NAD(P)H dehydrogenase (quinone)
MNLVGIAGSLRRRSYNRSLLAVLGAELTAPDELTILDEIGLLPLYNEDIDKAEAPASVERLRTRIREADALVFATPEYNGSVPGPLKNAIDWASRPWPDHSLQRKPALVLGASTSMFGALWAQAELRRILRVIGADVIDFELPIRQAERVFNTSGHLIDLALRHALRDALVALRRASEQPTTTHFQESGALAPSPRSALGDWLAAAEAIPPLRRQTAARQPNPYPEVRLCPHYTAFYLFSCSSGSDSSSSSRALALSAPRPSTHIVSWAFCYSREPSSSLSYPPPHAATHVSRSDSPC